MSPTVLGAVALALTSGIVALLVPLRVRPHVAAKVTTLFAVAAALATVLGLLIIARNSVVHVHDVAEGLSWCGELAGTRNTLTPLEVFAILGAFASAWSAVRVRRVHRQLRAPEGDATMIVIDCSEPTAYAIPGKPGKVVVSSSMLRSLDDGERRALLAHERAHLRCAHHRYVRLTQLAGAAAPPLRLLNSRVRFFTERWADEEAATEVGDRSVVARAIARAALARTVSPVGAHGIGDSDVVARVESLLADAPNRAPTLELAFATFALLAVIAFGALTISLLLTEPWLPELFEVCI